jgi:hypothetical protein
MAITPTFPEAEEPTAGVDWAAAAAALKTQAAARAAIRIVMLCDRHAVNILKFTLISLLWSAPARPGQKSNFSLWHYRVSAPPPVPMFRLQTSKYIRAS